MLNITTALNQTSPKRTGMYTYSHDVDSLLHWLKNVHGASKSRPSNIYRMSMAFGSGPCRSRRCWEFVQFWPILLPSRLMWEDAKGSLTTTPFSGTLGPYYIKQDADHLRCMNCIVFHFGLCVSVASRCEGRWS